MYSQKLKYKNLFILWNQFQNSFEISIQAACVFVYVAYPKHNANVLTFSSGCEQLHKSFTFTRCKYLRYGLMGLQSLKINDFKRLKLC